MSQRINELQQFVVSAFQRVRYEHDARATVHDTDAEGPSSNDSANPFADELKQEDDWLKLAQKEGSIEKCWATSLNVYEDNYAFFLAMYLYLFSEAHDWTLGFWLLENLCDLRKERMAMHKTLEQDQRKCVGLILRSLSTNTDLSPYQQELLMMSITDFWEADLPKGAAPVHHDRTLIENQIRSAFDGIRLEDGVSLHQTIYKDNFGNVSDEVLRQIELDERNDWTKLISDPDLPRILIESGMPFFDFKGFKFHLPAYMILSLHKNFYSEEFLIYNLTDVGTYQRGRYFDWLTPNQRKCVALFLKHYRDFKPYCDYHWPEINSALCKYWDPSSGRSLL